MNKKQYTTRIMTKRAEKKVTTNEASEKRTTNTQRCYKDTLFRMLFNKKENLLSLYNAVNRSSYTEVNDLEITTYRKDKYE